MQHWIVADIFAEVTPKANCGPNAVLVVHFKGLGSIILIMFIISNIGFYETNAIQFGMDQLLEASSTQLMSACSLVFLVHAFL